MHCHLIEAEKVLAVSVEQIQTTLSNGETYRVSIEGRTPYKVSFAGLLLNSLGEHGGELNSVDDKSFAAIRVRDLVKGNELIIGSGEWEKYRPKKVGAGSNDILFEEAKRIIGRLLYRVAEQPYDSYERSFKPWDLRASLGFDKYEEVLRNFQNRNFIAYYSDASGNTFTDRWIVTDKGIEHFEKQVKEESETKGIVSRTSPSITSKVVETAITDAETLLKSSGATSGVDRIHTALHGHLIAVCDSVGIKYGKDPSLTELFKLLRTQHPALQALGPRSQDISKVLNASANILDALNSLRNQASVAHPNPELLAEEEAMLVINTAKTLLHYLDSKFSK